MIICPNQALVFQRVVGAIHWITQVILIALIWWIMIYSVDGAISTLRARSNYVSSAESFRTLFLLTGKFYLK